MVDAKVEGMEELLKKLRILPEKVQKNVMSGAVRAGAKPIIEEAKALVPSKYSQLRESIGLKKASKPKVLKKTLLIYKISPMVKNVTRKFTLKDGTKWSIKGSVDGWYGHFIEFGTYARLDHNFKGKISGKRKQRRDKIVASGGGIAPHPFMRPAFEKKGEEAIDATRDYMRKRLDKEIAKL